jgi:hypothetical protein
MVKMSYKTGDVDLVRGAAYNAKWILDKFFDGEVHADQLASLTAHLAKLPRLIYRVHVFGRVGDCSNMWHEMKRIEAAFGPPVLSHSGYTCYLEPY